MADNNNEKCLRPQDQANITSIWDISDFTGEYIVGFFCSPVSNQTNYIYEIYLE